MNQMTGLRMVQSKRRTICSCVSSAFLLFAALIIGSAFLVADFKQSLLPWQTINIVKTTTFTTVCETQRQCMPDGSEALPRRIVRRTSELQMRHLWGPPIQERSKSPMSLLAVAVGIKQKGNVDKIVQKFPPTEFVIMLFHYDGNVDGWKDLEWCSRAIHVSAVNQTKWWFAKRFLHPDIVAEYAYIFLWDEDLGAENFHGGRYLSVVKEEGLQISQPAIDPEKSEIHHKFTARDKNSKVHRRDINPNGPGRRCYEDSTEPPCTGYVEMMAPVFSRASWRCVWYMMQNDLIHAWALDYQFGYCAQGNRTENIGIVDSEYLVHYGLPTLGGSAVNNTVSNEQSQASQNGTLTSHESVVSSVPDPSEYRHAIRRRSSAEFEMFRGRWKKAVREDECWIDPFHPPMKQNK